MTGDAQPLLRVRDLVVRYGRGGLFGGRSFNAVDGVSFDVMPGETLAIVGESGCGKSTLGKAILGLIPAASGSVEFEGRSISGLNDRAMRSVRRRLQMIFQDNYSALDPRSTALRSTAEPLRAFGIADKRQAGEMARDILSSVGLAEPIFESRPARLSGGQRQRVGIARAIAPEPQLIVADEPVSALDVSVQAQVLNLLKEQQKERGLALLYISHDLRSVKFMADRVAVMYLGRIVETGSAEEVIADPQHPYTRALVSASPAVNGIERIVLKGEIPSPLDPPQGCRFHTRCPLAFEACPSIDPPLVEIGSGRAAACLLLTKK